MERKTQTMDGNMAAAWTIKSQQELDEAKKHFDVFIFDSFIPD